MKDSGIKWAPSIADSFTTKRLKYLLYDRNEKNNPIITSDILSLTAKQGVVPLAEKEGGGNKPKEDLSLYRVTRPGDIVMNCMNVISGSVAISNYYGCLSPVYYTFRTIDSEDDERFFNYIFQTTQFQRSLVGFANGILIKESSNGKLNTIRLRVSTEMLGSLFVPYTSSDNQKKIADYLDFKCSEIDALSADIQTEIDTLEAYKRSVITEAVTKGLDKNVEMKDSGIEWVGEIPSSWEVHPVYCYFSERKNKNYALQEQNLLSLSYGKIIKKDIDTVGGLLPASFNTYNIVEEGDIIIRPTDLQNDKRSLRTGLVTERGIITSAYIDLAPKSGVNSAYFHYLLHSFDIQKVFYNMGNGVRQGLNYSEFSKLMVFAPYSNEQESIVEYLNAKCSEIEEIITQKQEQIEVLADYKKSLIYEYVTGKKEVPAV